MPVAACGHIRARRSLEHAIGVRGRLRDGLAHVPVLGDLAPLEAEHVDDGKARVGRLELRVHRQDHVVTVDEHPLDVGPQCRKLRFQLLQQEPDAIDAILAARVVLNEPWREVAQSLFHVLAVQGRVLRRRCDSSGGKGRAACCSLHRSTSFSASRSARAVRAGGLRPSSNPDACAATCSWRSRAIPPDPFRRKTVNQLITEEQRAQMLANGRVALARSDFDPAPVVKLFTPDGSATWLLAEIDPQDPDRAFGLCDLGFGFPELGWVSLAQIAAVRGRLGLPVERDLHFTPRHSMRVYAYKARLACRIVE